MPSGLARASLGINTRSGIAGQGKLGATAQRGRAPRLERGVSAPGGRAARAVTLRRAATGR